MATERLIHEVKTGDVPRISLGNFAIRPVDRAFARQTGKPAANGVPATNGAPTINGAPATNGAKADQKPIAQQFLERPEPKPVSSLGSAEFPLNLLEDKTFAGTGYNMIWRPRSNSPLEPRLKENARTNPDIKQDDLELNLTAETMAFTKSLGNVPNRGLEGQADLMLKGISYVQRVGAFENLASGSNDSPEPVGIHFEPGIFMFVPKSEVNPKGQPATINRMASVPHGTTINAQGLVTSQQNGKPNMDQDIESIVPFVIGDPKALRAKTFEQHLNFNSDIGDHRLPNLLKPFGDKSTQAHPAHVC